jgi:cell division protein FtsB
MARVRLPRLGLSNTRRATALAIVVAALALTIAVPLRTYLSQRSDLADQASSQQQLQRQVDALQHRDQQLRDPEQIKAEARKRLRYVMPGETPYLVQLPEDVPDAGTAPDARKQIATQTWYTNLWDSINK